jgi:hypothetical protein
MPATLSTRIDGVMAMGDDLARAVAGGRPTGRRQRHSSTRGRFVKASFHEAEHAQVRAAAARAGMTPAGYVAEAALAAARGEHSSGPGGITEEFRSALLEVAMARSHAGWIGTLLHQAVKELRASGKPPGELLPIAEECQRKLLVMERATEAVRKRLQEARKQSRTESARKQTARKQSRTESVRKETARTPSVRKETRKGSGRTGPLRSEGVPPLRKSPPRNRTSGREATEQ